MNEKPAINQIIEERDCLSEGLRNIVRLLNPENREPEDIVTAYELARRLTEDPQEGAQRVYPKESPAAWPRHRRA